MKPQFRHQPSGSTVISASLIILLALLTALDAMAIDMYLPGMPKMAESFGVSPGLIQQTLSIFLIGLAIGQGIYGPLLDRFGRRIPLLIGVIVFIIGSVLAAFAPSIEWLLFARFVQAIGASAGLVAPRAIVADLCTLAESARVFSLLMQVMMIAPILAPLIGGYMLVHGDWRSIFWIMAFLGVIGLLWGLRGIPDSLPVEKRASLHLGHIVAAYLKQARNAIFMAYALSGGFALGALFLYISNSPFVFTAYFGFTPTQFSYLFAANSVCLVFGGMLANYLLRRGMPTPRILVLGLIVHTMSGAILFLASWLGMSSLIIYSGLLALSIGALGLVFGNVTALTMNSAGAQAGVASALMGVLHYLIAAVVGYFASLATPSLETLPFAIGVCGSAALILYYVAVRATHKGTA